MPSWSTFAAEAPELAAAVRRHFDAYTHKTLATIRADGAPRICGSECEIVDGELYIGSMLDALKARDLRRDPRFALHSGSASPPDFSGDAKVAGVAEEVASDGSSHRFRLDITEASTTHVDNALIITVWTPGGVRQLRR